MSFVVYNKAVTTTSTDSGSKLTPEQLKRMEENRQRALKIQQANMLNQQKSSSSSSSSTFTKHPSDIKPNNVSNVTTLQNMNNQNTKPAEKTSPTKQSNGTIDSTHGKCAYLADELDRFEIIVGYNQALINLFKSVGSRKYEPTTKRWNFSIKNYEDIMFRIKHELNNTVKIEPLDGGGSTNAKVARFYLIDRNRFEVQAEYDAELQELFKTMTTKKYDATNKRWSFDLKDYNELVKKITDKFSRSKINVDPLPKLVREIFKDQIAGKQTHRIDPEIDLDLLKTKIDLNITKNLLSFQIEGICFGVQQQGRLLLADDMGLGKTLQACLIF